MVGSCVQMTMRAPRWRCRRTVDNKVFVRVCASADSFMNCDTKGYEWRPISSSPTHLVCFVKCNDAARSHILLEKDAQAYVEERASSFWSDTWARQIHDGEETRLKELERGSCCRRQTHLRCPVISLLGCRPLRPSRAHRHGLRIWHEALQGLQSLGERAKLRRGHFGLSNALLECDVAESGSSLLLLYAHLS